MNGDAEVVTLTDDGHDARDATPRSASASTGWPRALRELGVERRRPRRDVRLEHASATSSSTSPRRAWAPCCTRSTSGCSPSSSTYIVNHAEDKVIFVDDSLVAGAREARADRSRPSSTSWSWATATPAQLPERDRATRSCSRARSRGFDYPELDDAPAAGLCYTSGTTGNPKGVLYSHRSNVLHAMAHCMADAIGHRARRPRAAGRADVPRQRVGPPVRGARWSGADLVMPGRFLQAEPLAKLIESEQVTVAGGVPTIWLDLLRYADEHKPDLSSLRIVIVRRLRRARAR